MKTALVVFVLFFFCCFPAHGGPYSQDFFLMSGVQALSDQSVFNDRLQVAEDEYTLSLSELPAVRFGCAGRLLKWATDGAYRDAYARAKAISEKMYDLTFRSDALNVYLALLTEAENLADKLEPYSGFTPLGADLVYDFQESAENFLNLLNVDEGDYRPLSKGRKKEVTETLGKLEQIIRLTANELRTESGPGMTADLRGLERELELLRGRITTLCNWELFAGGLFLIGQKSDEMSP